MCKYIINLYYLSFRAKRRMTDSSLRHYRIVSLFQVMPAQNDTHHNKEKGGKHYGYNRQL